MKNSRYNHYSQLGNGLTIFFNFYTLKLIVLKEGDTQKALSFFKNPHRQIRSDEEKKLKVQLQENGFLINQEIDELFLLKQSYISAKTSVKNLELTIAPTLGCNFACPYCYQEGNEENMSTEVQNNLYKFTLNQIQHEGTLHVTWFGGEPLIRWDQIKKMSSEFQNLCVEKKASYSASLITNGYLLNKIYVNQLKELKIEDIQVTIDGPPEVHNQRRTLRNGSPTFKKILQNIKDIYPFVKLSLRMNVDSSNIKNIDAVLNILEKEGLKDKIGFYLGQVLPYTEVCSNISDSCLADKKYAAIGFKTLVKMAAKDFKATFAYPKALSNFCMADRRNAFVISPTGNISKCWNSIGNKDDSIGNLLAIDKTFNNRSWDIPDPFDDECKDCLLLPICMGGCPFLKSKTGKRDCTNWKYYLDEYLLFYYYLKNKELELDILSHIRNARLLFRKINS